MDIGKIIQNRRKELGLTLEEVGTAVGVGKSTVLKWESGYISNMRRDKIALLAKVLHMNPTELLIDDEEPAAENGDGQEIKLSANDKIIIELLMSLSDSKKAEAIRYLRYLAEQSDK